MRGTLPVARVHVGCVTIPVTGAEGVTGWGSIVILEVDTEVQPEEFVTEYV